MQKYLIGNIYADGYERIAEVKNALGEKFFAHFLEYEEYIENNERSKLRKEGDFIEGDLLIDLVCVTRKQNGELMHEQPIFQSSHINAIVDVIEIIDDYSILALTDFCDGKLLIQFEKKIKYSVYDRIYVEGSLEFE